MDDLPSCRGHVINLARREGRRGGMVQLRGSGLDYDVLEAVDGAARMCVGAEFAPPWYRLDAGTIQDAIPSLPAESTGAHLDYCRDLTPGEVGCALSHAALWASAASDAATSVHIAMEDDLGRFDPVRSSSCGCAIGATVSIGTLFICTGTPAHRAAGLDLLSPTRDAHGSSASRSIELRCCLHFECRRPQASQCTTCQPRKRCRRR